jgi:hypothetical protein
LTDKKSDFVERQEKRLYNLSGSLPFVLFRTDGHQELSYILVDDLSKTSIGIVTSTFIEPSSTLWAEYKGHRIIFSVVHCTFMPNVGDFRCGLTLQETHGMSQDLEQIFAENGDLEYEA